MNYKVKTITFNREYSPPGSSFTNYYFNIEFTNSKTGQFATNKRQQTKIEVGKEYDVYIKKTDSKGHNIYDIKREEKFKSSYNDPKNIKQQAFSVCQSVAVKTSLLLNIDVTRDEINSITLKLYEWCISEGADKARDIASLKWNALLRQEDTLKLVKEDYLKKLKEFYPDALANDIINMAKKDMVFLNNKVK